MANKIEVGIRTADSSMSYTEKVETLDKGLKELLVEANTKLNGHYFPDMLESFHKARLLYGILLATPNTGNLYSLRQFEDFKYKLCDLLAGRKKLKEDKEDRWFRKAKKDNAVQKGISNSGSKKVTIARRVKRS